jgi:uncharacterized surface protein with fasciclin (FAS1) repeats
MFTRQKPWLTTALAALALTLAACGTTPSTPTAAETDPNVLGTMSLDGTMRDLEGNVVTPNASGVRALSSLSIRLDARATPAPAVRVVHGSPDTPAVDVLVNDKVAIEDLTYQDQAGPASLPAGTYNVKVNLANTATTAINANLTLENGAYYSAYALGFTRNIGATVLRELPFKLSGVGLVRLLHGSPTAPAVDVYLSRPGRDINRLRPILRNVNFKDASPYFAVRPGELQVTITPAGTKTVAISAKLDVADGSLQTAVAADAPGGGAPLGAYVVDELAGEPAPPAPQSILEIAAATPALSTLVSAVQSAGLVAPLSGKGPFTVFAPTNDAFAKLAALPSSETLKNVLLYHVASGAFTARDLRHKRSLQTLLGERIQIRFQNGMLILNDSVGIVTKDIVASNGIVHVINAVLIPPSLAPKPKSILEIAGSDPRFSTLVSAVKATGLDKALDGKGPFTVFAPTNDAFEALRQKLGGTLPSGNALRTVLLYHVATQRVSAAQLLQAGFVKTLQGQNVTAKAVGDKVVLNGSVNVLIADINASNGVIHAIDAVLLPPNN